MTSVSAIRTSPSYKTPYPPIQGSSRDAPDGWFTLWKLQRDETVSRLKAETQEFRSRQDLSNALRSPNSTPHFSQQNRRSLNADNITPTKKLVPRPPQQPPPSSSVASRTEYLRQRISNLNHTKQVLLSDFLLAKIPQACKAYPNSDIATVDPDLLDDDSYKAILSHLDLLDADTTDNSQNGYYSSYMPRLSNPRPNTINTMETPWISKQHQQQRVQNVTWQTVADGTHSFSAAAPYPSPWIQHEGGFLPPINSSREIEEIPLTVAEQQARRTLSVQLLSLPEPLQKAVSEEVQLSAPHAFSYSTSHGYPVLNPLLLPQKEFKRVKALVENMIETSIVDIARERERLQRRQQDRSEFLARERAREMERALDLERVRRAREEEIREEIKRDMAMVLDQAEREREARWQYETELRRQVDTTTIIMNQDPNSSKKLTFQSTGVSTVTSDELFKPFLDLAQHDLSDTEISTMKSKLYETASQLDSGGLLAFADFVRILQPDAIRNNAVYPNAFRSGSLHPALAYAKHLQSPKPFVAAPTPTNMQSSSAPLDNSIADTNAGASTIRHVPSPPVNSPIDVVNRTRTSIMVQSSDASRLLPSLSRSEQQEREEASQRIYALPINLQVEVCTWLQQNAPECISHQGSRTVIDTRFMSVDAFQGLLIYLDRIEDKLQ